MRTLKIMVITTLFYSFSSFAFYPYLCVLADIDNDCSDAINRYSITYKAPNTELARLRCKKRARSREDRYCFNLDYFDTSYKRCANDNADLVFECELRQFTQRGTKPYYKKVKASSEEEAIKICKEYIKDKNEFRFFDKVLADCK